MHFYETFMNISFYVHLLYIVSALTYGL